MDICFFRKSIGLKLTFGRGEEEGQWYKRSSHAKAFSGLQEHCRKTSQTFTQVERHYSVGN